MEVAYIESISDTLVLLKLEFVVSGDYFRTCKGTFCVDDYGNFPIAPARILLDTEARSVALSNTKGLWRSDQWGPAPNTSAQSPSGSLLQAEFRFLDWKAATPDLSDRNRAGLKHPNGISGNGLPSDNSFCRGLTCTHGTGRTSVGARWRLLKSLTSGVFCTSLNKNNVFSSPFYYDGPRHESSSGISVGQYFPEESVCTENIDMWKRLIPNIPFNEEKYSATSTESNNVENETDNSLKRLIDKNWLLNSPWHSLRYEAKSGVARNVTVNNNISQHKKERFKQELSMTLTITAILLPKTVPSHSMILEQLKKYEKRNKNSQSKVFNNYSKRKTAPKKGENTYVDPSFIRLHRQVRDSRERNFFVEMIIEDTTSSSSSCATVPGEHSLPSDPTHHTMTSQDMYSSSSYSSGSDSNDNVSRSTRVHVTELLPPFYDLLLHTYTYTITQKSQNNSKNENQIKKDFYVADLESFKFYSIGLNDNECYNRNNDKKSFEGFELSPDSDYGEASRTCYGSISWSIDLPFGGLLRTQFTGEKKYLHREQYPSDASRGFIVPPVFVAVISTPTSGIIHQSKILYTPLVSSPTLITFPLPDASMPFNVTTLVCTVMSFLLGSLMNTLLRKKIKIGPKKKDDISVKERIKMD